MSADKDAEAEMNRQLLGFMLSAAIDKVFPKKKPVQEPVAPGERAPPPPTEK